MAPTRAILFCIHGRDDAAVQQVLVVGRQLRSLDHAQPAVLVGVLDDEVRVLQNFVVDRDHHAFHRREQINAPAFAG